MRPADPDPVQTTRATYDRVAAGYLARNSVVPPDFAAWRDEWLTTLAPGAPVLDAGAGPGRHTSDLAAGRPAVALDLSPAMAALARARAVPVVLGDVRRLPFGPGVFGGVWSAAALLHVPRPHVPGTLAEWRRVTAPGGGLALSTATGGTDGWEEAPYERVDAAPAPRWFVHHDADGLTGLLDAAGWQVTWLGRERGSTRSWLRVLAVAA